MEHMHELGLVGRSHHANARNHATIYDIEHAVVRRAIVAHEPCAIEAKHHIGIRKGIIDYELVKRTLHERRVNAHDGLFPAKRQAARKRDGMFLGNTRINKSLREFLRERGQARAIFHGSRDGDNIVVALGFSDNSLREYARVLRGGA